VKTCISTSLLPALVTGMSLLLEGRMSAQTFSVLHAFSQAATNSQGYYTNSDGANPEAGLVSSGPTVYGTTVQGTAGGWGTVFSVNTDGTDFTNLYNFTPLTSNTNSDGAFPGTRLLLSGTTLYGTAENGGSSGAGTIFSLNLNDLAFTNLHNFSYTDGSTPSTLSLSTNDVLYGATYGGGSSGYGTLFRINPDGSGFTNLYNFSAPSGPFSTNTDGAHPRGGLFVSGGFLYGTTYDGGRSGFGAVFRFNTDFVSVLKTLHDFTALSNSTNSDGANPIAGVVLSGTNLYGTASDGGVWGDGTVFAIGTAGVGFTFTNLHSFAGYPSDGTYPYGRLILFSNILYGTTSQGGNSGVVTVFALNTDGTGLTNLHSFSAVIYNAASGFFTNSDGFGPFAGLSFSLPEDTLYGTAMNGGSSGVGTVFSLSLPPPPLTIALTGTNVVLTWPPSAPGANYAGFVLQGTTNLTPPVWNNVDGPSPRTNAISGPQMFYQLKQEVKEMPF
jgi:uncharacterized repeat protein (TIGR03803 family)